jgi:dTDP-4-amino-4,6-dideoxygalactose transaminase
MPNTDQLSSRLLRLPLWLGLGDDVVETIATEIQAL